MEITIEDKIRHLQTLKCSWEVELRSLSNPVGIEIYEGIVNSLDTAINIMCKYQQLQADYENQLKANLKDILIELQLEIEKQCKIPNNNASAYDWNNGVYACYKIVQEKISALKGEEE